MKNAAMEDVAPAVNIMSLNNLQAKMLEIAVNMKKLKNVALNSCENEEQDKCCKRRYQRFE